MVPWKKRLFIYLKFTISVCYNKFYSTFPYNDVPLVRPPYQTDKKGSLEVSCSGNQILLT